MTGEELPESRPPGPRSHLLLVHCNRRGTDAMLTNLHFLPFKSREPDFNKIKMCSDSGSPANAFI